MVRQGSAHVSRMCSIFYLAVCINSCARTYARLSPPGQVFDARFSPPYDNRTIMVNLRVYDWWLGTTDTAVLPQGTKLSIVDSSCTNNPSQCPSWTVPADINFQFGPVTPQDTYRMVIFMTDSGTRVPMYSAPFEQISSTSGCLGTPGTVCCGATEYSLTRTYGEYAAIKMWISRVNGTEYSNGSQVENFRSAGAQLKVTSGYYTGIVNWPNFFYQLNGTSYTDGVTSRIFLAADTLGVSYNDFFTNLVNNYTLFVPTSDPGAPGFVVPNSQIPEQPAPINPTTWAACRSSQCSAPVGTCNSAASSQGPTPYSAWRNTSTATVIANTFNHANQPVYRTCSVLGNGQKQFINPDGSLGDMHVVQYVTCDYQSTFLNPVVSFPRAMIEAGNTAPPPPADASVLPHQSESTNSPSPSSTPSAPVPTLQRPPVLPYSSSPLSPPISSGISSLNSTGSDKSTIPSSNDGISVYIQAILPAFSPAQFNATGQAEFTRAILTTTLGATVTPVFRYRNITAVNLISKRLSSRRSLLVSTVGTLVDCVLYFGPSDTTPATLLVSLLKNKPATVLPTGTFGNVTVNYSNVLNCVSPCGTNGVPGPRITGGGVTCTCECNAGWITTENQSFTNFSYCSEYVGSSSSGATGGGTGNGNTNQGEAISHNAILDAWRPPVPIPPPPPPVQYQTSSGMSAGTAVGIVIGVLIVGIIIYISWRTGGFCCIRWYSACIVCFWQHCGKPNDSNNNNNNCQKKKKNKASDKVFDDSKAIKDKNTKNGKKKGKQAKNNDNDQKVYSAPAQQGLDENQESENDGSDTGERQQEDNDGDGDQNERRGQTTDYVEQHVEELSVKKEKKQKHNNKNNATTYKKHNKVHPSS